MNSGLQKMPKPLEKAAFLRLFSGFVEPRGPAIKMPRTGLEPIKCFGATNYSGNPYNRNRKRLAVISAALFGIAQFDVASQRVSDRIGGAQ